MVNGAQWIAWGNGVTTQRRNDVTTKRPNDSLLQFSIILVRAKGGRHDFIHNPGHHVHVANQQYNCVAKRKPQIIQITQIFSVKSGNCLPAL